MTKVKFIAEQIRLICGECFIEAPKGYITINYVSSKDKKW